MSTLDGRTWEQLYGDPVAKADELLGTFIDGADVVIFAGAGLFRSLGMPPEQGTREPGDFKDACIEARRALREGSFEPCCRIFRRHLDAKEQALGTNPGTARSRRFFEGLMDALRGQNPDLDRAAS